MLNTTNLTAETTMFLDPAGPVGIQRYDMIKYPIFDKLRKKQTGYFWQADEVDGERDGKDFKKLTSHGQHIFTSNIKRQIVLDTKQGRAPSSILAPIATLPEVEAFTHTWNYFENIHSESYTHIIKNVYSHPSDVMDSVLSIDPILQCAKSISAPYDELETFNTYAKMHEIDPNMAPSPDSYEHKASLWRCLNAVNALEGIRFYVSFACSWAFAEVKMMEGNAKIIKLIARDENIHLAATQQMLKLMPKDDPAYIQIKNDNEQFIWEMFHDVAQQEIDWAAYLFKDGSIIGLNYELAAAYVKWLTNKRAIAIGVKPIFVDAPAQNPLPWTQKWIAGSDVQVAPQEVEVSSYIVGGTVKDANASMFSGYEL